MIENVVLIGAGNLATQLALAMHENGTRVKQVYSRDDTVCQGACREIKM